MGWVGVGTVEGAILVSSDVSRPKFFPRVVAGSSGGLGGERGRVEDDFAEAPDRFVQRGFSSIESCGSLRG